MQRVGRKVYWAIRLLPLAAVFLLMFLAAETLPSSAVQSVAGFLGVVFLGWAFLGWLLAPWLVPILVSKLTCPSCHEEIDAVNVWQCGCGYKDHRERHVLAMKCPKCGSRFGHVDCPRCSATILLW